MSITREKKLDLAKMIIEESKARGLYKPMPNGKYVTPSLLASTHSLVELRAAFREITR